MRPSFAAQNLVLGATIGTAAVGFLAAVAAAFRAIVLHHEDAGAQATRQSDGVAFDALVSEPGGLENREAVGRVANET